MDNSNTQFTINHAPGPPFPALPVLGGLLNPRAAIAPQDLLAQQHGDPSQCSEPAKKARKPYTITKQREKWTDEEHERFLEALRKYGRAWRKIEEHVGTKTAVQIRSHAQKFFSKVERKKEAGEADAEAEDIDIPPPRPKRKPAKPYPRKDTGADSSGIVDVGALNGIQHASFGLPHIASVASLPKTLADVKAQQAQAQQQAQQMGVAPEQEVTEATVAAVAAAASAAAAAAAAAVVAAAGQQVQAHLQVHPPKGFPFFGVPPQVLANMTAYNMAAVEQHTSQVAASSLPVSTSQYNTAQQQSYWRSLSSEEQAHAQVPAVKQGSKLQQQPLAEATATTDGTHVLPGGPSRDSDGDSACSRETANPQAEQVRKMSDIARCLTAQAAQHHKGPPSGPPPFMPQPSSMHYAPHPAMWHGPAAHHSHWQLAAAAAAAVQQQQAQQALSQQQAMSQGQGQGPWGMAAAAAAAAHGGAEGAGGHGHGHGLPPHHWLMGVISDAAKAGMDQAWQMQDRRDGRSQRVAADPSGSSGAAQRQQVAEGGKGGSRASPENNNDDSPGYSENLPEANAKAGSQATGSGAADRSRGTGNSNGSGSNESNDANSGSQGELRSTKTPPDPDTLREAQGSNPTNGNGSNGQGSNGGPGSNGHDSNKQGSNGNGSSGNGNGTTCNGHGSSGNGNGQTSGHGTGHTSVRQQQPGAQQQPYSHAAGKSPHRTPNQQQPNAAARLQSAYANGDAATNQVSNGNGVSHSNGHHHSNGNGHHCSNSNGNGHHGSSRHGAANGNSNGDNGNGTVGTSKGPPSGNGHSVKDSTNGNGNGYSSGTGAGPNSRPVPPRQHHGSARHHSGPHPHHNSGHHVHHGGRSRGGGQGEGPGGRAAEEGRSSSDLMGQGHGDGSEALHAMMAALQAQAKMDISAFANYYTVPQHPYQPPPPPDAYAAMVARLKTQGIGLAAPAASSDMVAAAAAMAAVGGPAAALSQLMAGQQDASAMLEAQARLQSQAAGYSHSHSHSGLGYSHSVGHGHGGYGVLQSAYQHLAASTAAAVQQHMAPSLDPAAAAAAKAMEQLAAGASAMQHTQWHHQHPHPQLSGQMQYSGGTFVGAASGSKGGSEPPATTVLSGGPGGCRYQQVAAGGGADRDRASLKRPSSSQEALQGAGSRKKASQ